MSTHNIHFHDKIRKFHLNIPEYLFAVAVEEFPRDSKTSSNKPC